MNKLKKAYLDMNELLCDSRRKMFDVFSKYLSGELEEKDVTNVIDVFFKDYNACYQEILKYEKSILNFAINKETFDLASKIVDNTAKDVIVRKQYIKAYLPLNDEQIEYLTERIYNFLDAFCNVVDSKDILTYIHFNSDYSVNYNRPRGAGGIVDSEMEVIKNIVKNYKPKSLKK